MVHTLAVPERGHLIAITLGIAAIHTEGVPRVELIGDGCSPEVEGDRGFEHSLSTHFNLFQITRFLADDIAEILAANLDLLLILLSVHLLGRKLWSWGRKVPRREFQLIPSHLMTCLCPHLVFLQFRGDKHTVFLS